MIQKPYLSTGHKKHSITFLNSPINDSKIDNNAPIWIIVTAKGKQIQLIMMSYSKFFINTC